MHLWSSVRVSLFEAFEGPVRRDPMGAAPHPWGTTAPSGCERWERSLGPRPQTTASDHGAPDRTGLGPGSAQCGVRSRGRGRGRGLGVWAAAPWAPASVACRPAPGGVLLWSALGSRRSGGHHPCLWRTDGNFSVRPLVQGFPGTRAGDTWEAVNSQETQEVPGSA